MERSIPEALRRVYQRLLQRDAAGMVAERVSAASIFAGLEWLSRGPIRRLPALPHAAPVFAQLLDEVCSQRSDDCPHRPTTRGDLQFGIGLIAGCHLRDAAERDQPMPATIDFRTAMASLDTSDARSTLWALGLPGDVAAVLRLVDQLTTLAPGIEFQLLLGTGMAQGLPRSGASGVDGLPFVMGLIGAGITPPTAKTP